MPWNWGCSYPRPKFDVWGGAWYIVGIRTHRPSWWGPKKYIMVTRSSLNTHVCYSASLHLDLEKPMGDSLRALRVGPVSHAQVVKNEGVFAKRTEIRHARSGYWDAEKVTLWRGDWRLGRSEGETTAPSLKGSGGKTRFLGLKFAGPALRTRYLEARIEWRVQSLTGGSVTSIVKLHEGSCKPLDKTTCGGEPWETFLRYLGPPIAGSVTLNVYYGVTRPATNRENVEWKN
ncbi:hypothetical protein EDB83DRAFT_2315509 [Lactarius deliciosus]|nr:hypothetical protein EDB83DRAFT_2315509 [Lactarius deliciosus]